MNEETYVPNTISNSVNSHFDESIYIFNDPYPQHASSSDFKLTDLSHTGTFKQECMSPYNHH